MWQGLLLMREDRNNDQHGRDNIEQVGKEQEKLLRKNDQLYTQEETIDPEDRTLYHKPVERWQDKTNKKTIEWINLAEPLTKNTKEKPRTRNMDPRQPLIGSFFAAQRQEPVPKNTRMRSKPRALHNLAVQSWQRLRV
jgi:hypothetical protein